MHGPDSTALFRPFQNGAAQAPASDRVVSNIRILLATTGYPPEYSGSGSRLHALYTRLSSSSPGLEWKVVTKGPDRAENAHITGPSIIHRRATSASDKPVRSVSGILSEISWIRGLLRNGLLKNVDLVHIAGWSWYSLILCRAAKRRDIPIIRELTSQGDTGDIGGVGRHLIRHTNRLADRFIAISPALSDMLRRTLPEADIWVRPNGINIETFRQPTSAERLTARASLKSHIPSLKESDTVVLSVARIRPLKNQVFLAKCLAALPDNFKLVFVGPAYHQDDDYLELLERTLEDPSLLNRATVFEGMHEDIRPFYWAADILAFPSTNEGLGNVMLEALCCGVPVTANMIPGVTDWIVAPDENGALSPLNHADFAQAISVTAKFQGRDGISEKAQARFDQRAIDAEYLRIFSDTVRH